MDKRKEANLRVRQAISHSLLELMQERPLSSISVSEVIRKAGVARASFYRNYTSKEDVLVGYVRYVLEDFREKADYDLSDYLSMRHIRRIFEYLSRYRSCFLNLHDSGHAPMVLDEFNSFHASIAGDMPANSDARYRLYFFIGAVYNSAVFWLKEDNPAPLDAVAAALLKAVAPARGPAPEA